MAEETRRCPKCGNECRKIDIFCNKCGERLPQEPPKCPVCGKEYNPGEDLFCNKCGTKLSYSAPEQAKRKKKVCPICDTEYSPGDTVCKMCGADLTLLNSSIDEKFSSTGKFDDKPTKTKQPSMFGLLIGVFCVVLFGSMILLHSFAPDSSVKMPKSMINDDGFSEERSAKPCDDETVKTKLIEEFKENYPYYNDIAESSINHTSVKTPMTIEFESSRNRYLCAATIILESQKGFKPNEYEESNNFYNLVKTDILSDNGAKQIKNAMKIKCDVKYSSEIAAGREIVTSSACGGGTSWSRGEEEIIWDRYQEYAEIPGEKERLQKEREEAKRLEEERLKEEQKLHEEEERKAQEILKQQQEDAKKAREEELKRLEAERKHLEELQKEAVSKQTDDIFGTIMPAGSE